MRSPLAKRKARCARLLPDSSSCQRHDAEGLGEAGGICSDCRELTEPPPFGERTLGRLASIAKVNAGLYEQACSRSNSALSSPRKANEDSNSSSGGSPGPGVPSYPDSSN